MAEAPNEEPIASLATRMLDDVGMSEQYGLVARPTRIGNHSDRPIFLIPISCPDGGLLPLGKVEGGLAKEIPAGDFIRVDGSEYKPDKIKPPSGCRCHYRCGCRWRIYILFREGHKAENVQGFLARFHERYPNGDGVEVEEGDALLFHYQLNGTFLQLNCDERGQVRVKDEDGGQISFAGTRLSSGMEFFRNARVVRLRNRDGRCLIALRSKGTVELGDLGSRDNSKWSVEFVLNSNSALLLRSCYDDYLAASDQRSHEGFAGHQVLLYRPPLDSFFEFVPVMEGTQVKLRTHYGTFLRTNDGHIPSPGRVTHDLPHCTTIFFDVEVVEREEEGSATKRHHETGEGNSVTTSPPGDTGLYRGDFWKLKNLLSDNNSGRKYVLIRGGSGTTAFVRELCTDIRENFDTIAWISNPQRFDSGLIREEILSQLILERGAFPEKFHGHPQMLSDRRLSLQQNARCLIVVDNLDDPRTWGKFEEISHVVNTCRVIFIARREMGSPSSQIDQYVSELETCELEDLSSVTWEYDQFLEKGFPSPPREFCQLIVRKCEKLHAAIVLVMSNRQDWGWSCSSEKWEARIPSSDNLCRELQFIQRVLENLCSYDHLFCLLYLCVFPENTRFSCERVSLLWFAEGLLPRWITAESYSYETIAERIFNDLLLKECIHPVETRSNGQLSTFRVDNRVREIMVSLPVLRDLVIKTCQGSAHLPEKARYVTVRGRIRDFKDKGSPELSSIFGLDVLSNEDETTTSEASPSGASEALPSLSHAKVLDLTGASLPMVQHARSKLIDPLRSEKQKKRLTDLSLRYLSLSDTLISEIGGFIENLKHLEFLDAKRSLVTKLPTQVARLTRIRHIMIYRLKKDPFTESYKLIGVKASRGIGGFEHLEKLCFVEASVIILRDLRNLMNLRHLGVTKLGNQHGEMLCSSLERLVSLESLDLHATDEDEIIALRGLRYSNLKHLSLHGCLGGLPDLILSLHGLTRIILRWSRLAEDLLAILGNLQNLVELELHQVYYDGEQLNFRESQFPELKILLLDELERLESMSLEQRALQRLENLTISRCHRLEQIPSGIEHVLTVRELTFVDMPYEFQEMVQADHENNRTLEHIRAIYFTQWAIGHWETHRFDQVTGSWQENAELRIPRVSESLYR